QWWIIALDLLLRNFFFSSRRRHTRWPRDWSSDVCSSDLLPTRELRTRAAVPIFANGLFLMNDALKIKPEAIFAVLGFDNGNGSRSEERRVGKECRSRWWWQT